MRRGVLHSWQVCPRSFLLQKKLPHKNSLLQHLKPRPSPSSRDDSHAHLHIVNLANLFSFPRHLRIFNFVNHSSHPFHLQNFINPSGFPSRYFHLQNFINLSVSSSHFFHLHNFINHSGLAPISSPLFRAMATRGEHSNSASMDVGGKQVTVVGASGVSESDIARALESTVFKQWLQNMTGKDGILTLGGSGGARCSLKRVIIQSVDYFGQRVGFVKFKAEVIDEASGAKLPGIVFGRGGAVGILILLESAGEKFAVLTEQARIPVGRTLLELPAGMLDSDDGDFVGTAAREIEEETGIQIKVDHLVDLTALLEERTGRKMFPSPGGSDEEITLFLYRGTVEREVIESLRGVETGLRDHGELIKVHVVPYASLWRCTADCKALAAIALYEMATREGILPPAPNL